MTRTRPTSSSAEPGPAPSWGPDPKLENFQAAVIALPDAVTYAGEPEYSLRATLVRRNVAQRSRAMLYIHGWNDYFFQRHVADEMAGAGYDFYAIDLRRYGRSLDEHQLAGFITDLGDYFVELDAAARVIRDEGHDELVVMGHSTGGLVGALWLDARPGVASALVLNSPWLELQGYPALRPALQRMFSAVGQLSPTAALPISNNGFNLRNISSREQGNWDFDTHLKGDDAFQVRVGWLSAVMAGQAKVQTGLSIAVPVLTLVCDRSDFRRKWSEDLKRADVVLDVERVAARAIQLGRHVTLVRIAGGMHDLALSDEPARSEYFTEVRQWLTAYAPGQRISHPRDGHAIVSDAGSASRSK